MNDMPDVLGLEPEEAMRRLAAAGFGGAVQIVSGRRREGRPRVIREKLVGGKPELIVSYFKELEIPPSASRGSPL